MEKNKVSIITSGYFPVPAALGGAVEALDENIIMENEKSQLLNLNVFSCYNKRAKEISFEYKQTNFIFIRIPLIIRLIDLCVYYFSKNIIKKEKSMSYRYICQRLYYILIVACKLYKSDYGKLVIENHSTLFLTLKLFSNYKKYTGRYYYHLHNVVTKDYHCRNIIFNCKKVMGVSNYINNKLKLFCNGADNNKYVVLKNKIDIDKFKIRISNDKKTEIRDKWKLKENDVVFLFTGRFSPEKGIEELLKAFRMIKDENIRLLIVGGYYYNSGMISPFEKKMKDLADSMNGKVIFTGFIDYQDIPKVYAIADAVVIPSIYDDPAPLTVIESLSSGKALITTESGGIPEYVNADTIVITRDTDIVNNLAKAIYLLYDNEELRRHMEVSAAEHTKNWSKKLFYNEFMEYLED